MIDRDPGLKKGPRFRPAIFRSAAFWLTGYALWWGTLWYLSSGPVDAPEFKIPHLDKIAHWGYFFGGAGMLSAGMYFVKSGPARYSWLVIALIVIVVMTLTGTIDEWHQTWHPERMGNDAGDLTADFLGAVAGFLVFKKMHRILL